MPDETKFDQREQNVDTQVNVAGHAKIDQVGPRIDTAGGDYVDGDKHVHIYQAPTEADKPRLPFEPQTVPIPAGEFIMGDDADTHAAPQHTISLPAFRVGRKPVTNGEYHHYLQSTGQAAPTELRWEKGTRPSPAQEKQPVCGVTWHEALAYCTWLAEQTKRAYTLPSEAQWERAACEEGDPPAMLGGIREWTTTLWGERRRAPDERYRYPWRPDDRRDDLIANDQVRRVTRGGGPRYTQRSSELPSRRGLSDSRISFRIVMNREE